MRSGAHVNRFWSLAVHVQTDPVFTGFNIGTRITQLSQYSIHGIWLGFVAHHFAA